MARSLSALRVGMGIVVCVALAGYYVAAATEHGRRVNTSKARADQSGYLGDAEHVYANWHGHQPPALIGERNRMPLYAGYLALFYHEGLSDPDFFDVAKRANIYLSLVLLIGLGALSAWQLPPFFAINLTGTMAFGCFVYKAGYAQSELLFYTLAFTTFLGCWHLLLSPRDWRAVGLAAVTGGCAGLAHLTKAAMLPFVAIFLTTYLASALDRKTGLRPSSVGPPARSMRWLVPGLVFVMAFLTVLAPYLINSKRVFGQYFYNVNSTFYVWYDDWPHASVGTYAHGDGVGWPTMPAAELPGAARYWREHSVREIGARVGAGFRDMATTSYRTFGFLPYVLVYLAMFVMLAATRGRDLWRRLMAHRWLAAFLVLYGLAYLLAIAFYCPTSGTGTGRFLLGHLAPLLFALSLLFAREEASGVHWSIRNLSLRLWHFNLLVACMLTLDVVFRLWPRLMTTYGGF
jgi:hypothetical protein